MKSLLRIPALVWLLLAAQAVFGASRGVDICVPRACERAGEACCGGAAPAMGCLDACGSEHGGSGRTAPNRAPHAGLEHRCCCCVDVPAPSDPVTPGRTAPTAPNASPVSLPVRAVDLIAKDAAPAPGWARRGDAHPPWAARADGIASTRLLI